LSKPKVNSKKMAIIAVVISVYVLLVAYLPNVSFSERGNLLFQNLILISLECNFSTKREMAWL
jgi:hypothetical protein